MLQVDINRGVLPGSKTPDASSYSPADAATLDRYAWGQQGGLGGTPVAAGYETLKALSQIPQFRKLLPMIAGALGFQDTGQQFQQDATSSPASVSNILTYIKGATDPRIERASAALLRGAGK